MHKKNLLIGAKYAFMAGLVLLTGLALAQNYPQNYFRFPVNIPVQLAANFGEVRMNHFHMGLDIRTQGRENIPVVAAADGYITRVSIANNGYGRAIYIQHAKGFTTVYGHLNSFYPALEQALRDTQFARKKWLQDVVLPPYAFPVNKGDEIALSGNTGSSGGPHVHFEIRNTLTEECINPLLFGLEIPDNIPPVISKAFWLRNNQSVYEQMPNSFAIRKQTNNKYVATLELNEPALFIALQMQDKTNTSPFNFGVHKVSWLLDDAPINSFELNKVSYPDSRAVNGCIDYAKFLTTNVPIQYLKKLPGVQLPIFETSSNNGAIVLPDTLPHIVTVLVSDYAGNTTSLQILVKTQNANSNKVFSQPSFATNQVNNASAAGAQLLMPATTLYDGVTPSFNYLGTTALKTSWQVLTPAIPAHTKYTVRLPLSSVQKNYAEKLVVQLQSLRYQDVQKPSINGALAEANFNRFGTISLAIDTSPPTIQWGLLKNNQKVNSIRQLNCTITDDNKTITSANAYLNGEWILLENITNKYTVYPGTKLLPGSHVLEVVATDLVGNTTQKTINFIVP